MTRLHLSVLGAVALVVVAPNLGWGQAVSVDAASLMRRLESMENRLRSMESQRPPVAQRPAPALAGSQAATYSLTDLDQRMGELEREVSGNSGNVDQTRFAVETLAKKFDEFSKDVTMRLNDLEARTLKAEKTAEQAPVAVVAPVTAVPTNVVTSAGTAVASPTVVPISSIIPSATITAGIPTSISPTDMYNKAYAYLTATDYPNAQAWLAEFTKRFPKNKLAENAWYWLGEVQLVQNSPAAAVVSFRNGLKDFPKGPKVAANLYKMGLALEQLQQPEMAKSMWDKLVKDYPKSSEAARAKQRLTALKITSPAAAATPAKK